MLKKGGERGGVGGREKAKEQVVELLPHTISPKQIYLTFPTSLYVSSFGVVMGVGRDGDSFSSSCIVHVVVVVVATAPLVVPIVVVAVVVVVVGGVGLRVSATCVLSFTWCC